MKYFEFSRRTGLLTVFLLFAASCSILPNTSLLNDTKRAIMNIDNVTNSNNWDVFCSDNDTEETLLGMINIFKNGSYDAVIDYPFKTMNDNPILDYFIFNSQGVVKITLPKNIVNKNVNQLIPKTLMANIEFHHEEKSLSLDVRVRDKSPFEEYTLDLIPKDIDLMNYNPLTNANSNIKCDIQKEYVPWVFVPSGMMVPPAGLSVNTSGPTETQISSLTSEFGPTDTIGPTITPTEIAAITATGIQYHIPGNSFQNSMCGVSFEYPLKWIIEPTEPLFSSDSFCSFGLKPENFETIKSQKNYCLGNYALDMAVINMGLADASSIASFVYEDGNWYTSGRQGMRGPAQMIRTRGLYILKGLVWVGYLDKECRAYAGIGYIDEALINAGGNKSIIVSDDSSDFQLHFEYILQTISITT